jgi:Zn-finger nucleic acid-binding protein
MSRVPTEGPEIDLCRRCQLMWFDAGELEAMPHRSTEAIAAEQKAERWTQEQRQWQRRRESDEAFLTWLRRHPVGGVFMR